MTTSKKIALGIGLASGVALTALLVTGIRAPKARDYMVRKAREVRNSLNRRNDFVHDENEAHYI